MERVRKLIQEELASGRVTQTGLAKALGISQASVYKLANTKTEHSVKMIAKISKHFKVNIADLLGEGKENRMKYSNDCLMFHSPAGAELCQALRLFMVSADHDQVDYLIRIIKHETRSNKKTPPTRK